MIACWSDTFLLSNTFATSGVKSAPAYKGELFAEQRDNARYGAAHVVSKKAAVRPRISKEPLFHKGIVQGQGSVSRCSRKCG